MTAVLSVETPVAHRPEECSAVAIATALAEELFPVVAGRAPVHRVRDHVTAAVAGKLLSARAWTAQGPDFRLRSVHACPVTDYAVEACVIIGTQDRVRALVLRLEQDCGRWICTRLSPV
ncbi:hypothetical protein GCM10011581_12490 [Saccharopolyspora subtropica]|uniref:3-hydroxyacyl-CoA dehydrogenase n=1 Tax=Saccharopolyspora thermophila TaxID=89367 RepID=A0A917JMR7_9PSEU|nr:Rv3235 family protein [Saccharopolyspora subtropica]GGI76903.1 hypothetical protein GCM10011581_12490 [Saccharopolyspora subtropica]